MEEYGEHWDDKPVCQVIVTVSSISLHADSQNDMLMWLMSEAKGVERSLEGWARRLLLINVIGIHSTALASNNIRYPPVLQP